MNRRRRARRGAPMTLFSFQDIIASVTGVVLFITFMLLLELVVRPATAASSPEVDSAAARVDAAERRLAELRRRQPAAPVSEVELAAAREATAALADLARVLTERADALAPQVEQTEAALGERRAELDDLQRRLEEVRHEQQRERARTRVTLLQGLRDGKVTWFIECTDEGLRVGQIDPGDGVTRFERAFGTAEEALQWAMTRPADGERFVLVVHPGGVEAFRDLQQALRAHGRDVGWDLWPGPEPLFTAEPDPEAADGAR